MIQNFDAIKKQLQELAEVVNLFKSEAVQLRIVELVLGSAGGAPGGPEGVTVASGAPSRRPRRRKPAAKESDDIPPASGKLRPTATKPGPLATLARLLKEGYFKTGRTIGDIVSH